jgi:hypothetical protein
LTPEALIPRLRTFLNRARVRQSNIRLSLVASLGPSPAPRKQ